ncbi:hypothetical protein EM20IM_09260 [Candidatus Methylacidiphilum infernorum]|uniref:Opacity protein or related surface antigen n=1 Tax=Candidatus Methylacidiphilum infernorum TaxID=511746 RepID=A0ABX7PV98_9BACT|nr:hypothetical protein [Candidatus Methylacidiphilum infernorum]QSR86653.1 hypothetical protein EM20IM_09260 [Candidatus Methylacidiphilum infernorum]
MIQKRVLISFVFLLVTPLWTTAYSAANFKDDDSVAVENTDARAKEQLTKSLRNFSLDQDFHYHSGVYAALYGGGGYLDSDRWTYTDTQGNIGMGNYGGSWGGIGGVKAGYQFKGWKIGRSPYRITEAVEFDGFYAGYSNPMNGYIGSFTGPVFHGKSVSPDMQLNVGIMTINEITKLITPYRFAPYIGFGVGGGIVTASNITGLAPAGVADITHSSTTGAFVLAEILGAEYYLTDHLSIFIEGKFIFFDSSVSIFKNVESFNIITSSAAKASFALSNFFQYIGVAGVKYVFW